MMVFERGEALSQICWTCHNLGGETNGVGPYLFGVMGRRAGSAEGFAYSQGLRESDLLWTEESLARFLLSPQVVFPGNRMVWPGAGTSGDARALAYYVRMVTEPE